MRLPIKKGNNQENFSVICLFIHIYSIIYYYLYLFISYLLFGTMKESLVICLWAGNFKKFEMAQPKSFVCQTLCRTRRLSFVVLAGIIFVYVKSSTVYVKSSTVYVGQCLTLIIVATKPHCCYFAILLFLNSIK